MHPEELCLTVHGHLRSLPVFGQPSEVPITDGLYFFYERGESSEHAPDWRIVRVGNHPQSDGTLVRRLREHYSNRKNSSVFRRYLGGALLRAEDPHHPCLAPTPGKGHWERKGEKPCRHCQPVEQDVSRVVRARFQFRCIAVSNRQERNRLEKALIATLSACPVCQPSREWLGRHAYPDAVRRAGMWNVQSVGSAPMSTADLRRFVACAASTPRG